MRLLGSEPENPTMALGGFGPGGEPCGNGGRNARPNQVSRDGYGTAAGAFIYLLHVYIRLNLYHCFPPAET